MVWRGFVDLTSFSHATVLHLAVQFTMGGGVVVVVPLFFSSSVELACEDEETVGDGYSDWLLIFFMYNQNNFVGSCFLRKFIDNFKDLVSLHLF